MKQTTDVGRKRLELLLSQPKLFKAIVIILMLFVLAMILFGAVAGSLLTAKLFPGIKL